MPHDTFQVVVGVKAVLTQHDPGEAAGGGVSGVDGKSPPAKIGHGRHIGAAEKPEQRTMGVDAERCPRDAVGQPRQQGPTQTDHRAAAQTLGFPADAVVDGDVDTFILVIAFLVGDMGDQLLVDTAPDIGQIDRLHSQIPFPNLVTSLAAELGSVHRKAAVDLEIMAGGETGILTCQERHRRGHLGGADQAAHRVGGAELTHLLGR